MLMTPRKCRKLSQLTFRQRCRLLTRSNYLRWLAMYSCCDDGDEWWPAPGYLDGLGVDDWCPRPVQLEKKGLPSAACLRRTT